MAKLDFGTQNIINNDQEVVAINYNLLDVRRTYGVIFVSENEKKEKLQVHYEIDVICIDQRDEHTCIFELQKHQTYINEKKPDTIIDELVEQCGAVLYPLHIQVNQSGEAIGIENQESLQKRWEIKKNEIAKAYKGKETEVLIQNMDAIISDTDQVSELLFQRDWFMNLFFIPIYKNKKQSVHKFPLLPYVPPILYQLKRKVTKHPHKEGDVFINLSGNCVDKRSEKDILRGNMISLSKDTKQGSGTCNLTYQLYKNSPLIDMITGSCKLEFPSKKKKKMTIEVYHLKNKRPLTSLEKQQALEKQEQEAPQPKQKKKKYFLFGKEIKFGK
jgi:hypothetical protein